jgi:hypothetical protein
MADYAPVQGHPAAVSFKAGAAITAGQLVRLVVPVVVPGGVEPTGGDAGDSRVLGIAGGDATIGGSVGPDPVTVLTGFGVIHESVTPDDAAAADLLFADADGQVTTVSTGGRTQVGFAVADAVPFRLPETDPGDPPDYYRVRWIPARG